MIVGLTGGIASGKSNIANELRAKGYTVIDSDKIARELQQIDGSVYLAIKEEFGLAYFDNDGSLNRKRLAELIFNDENARLKLNSISHPLIIEEIKDRIKNSTGIIFLDIPLLYETGLEYLCDIIVCVYVPRDIQTNRLINRDAISLEYANKKINSQMSLEKKKMLADMVIDSSGSFDETRLELEKILKKLKEKENGSIRN